MDYMARPLVLTAVFPSYPTGTDGVFYGNLGTGAIDLTTEITIRLPIAGLTTVDAPYNAPSASADWTFNFESFDKPGNESATPTAISSFIDCEPQTPIAMTNPDYTFATETLILTL